MLQDKINQYMEFFRGIDIQNNIIIIKVQFRNKWITMNYSDDTIKVSPSEKVPNEWFFYGNIKNTTIDKIFDFVEYNIKFNQEMENKKHLFDEKKEELIKLFSEHSIEELSKMKFVIGKSKKKKSDKNEILAIEDKNGNHTSEPMKQQPKKNISKNDGTTVNVPLKKDIIIKAEDVDNLTL